MKKNWMRGAAVMSITLLVNTVSHAGTLDAVKQGLKCGVTTGLAGFGELGQDGKWSGFDVDFVERWLQRCWVIALR